jgi:hypothetical protein
LTCHDAHGAPKRDVDCVRCHSPATVKASLHRLAGHSRCSACHTSHAPTPVSREACLSCHTKQLQHMPDAKVCTGCHQFR